MQGRNGNLRVTLSPARGTSFAARGPRTPNQINDERRTLHRRLAESRRHINALLAIVTGKMEATHVSQAARDAYARAGANVSAQAQAKVSDLTERDARAEKELADTLQMQADVQTQLRELGGAPARQDLLRQALAEIKAELETIRAQYANKTRRIQEREIQLSRLPQASAMAAIPRLMNTRRVMTERLQRLEQDALNRQGQTQFQLQEASVNVNELQQKEELLRQIQERSKQLARESSRVKEELRIATSQAQQQQQQLFRQAQQQQQQQQQPTMMTMPDLVVQQPLMMPLQQQQQQRKYVRRTSTPGARKRRRARAAASTTRRPAASTSRRARASTSRRAAASTTRRAAASTTRRATASTTRRAAASTRRASTARRV
jgi:DNA repair exonuclease SbcCD ATPase subunit